MNNRESPLFGLIQFLVIGPPVCDPWPYYIVCGVLVVIINTHALGTDSLRLLPGQ
jgi:hypothetical protein